MIVGVIPMQSSHDERARQDAAFDELATAIPIAVWQAEPPGHTVTAMSSQIERLTGFPASRFLQEPDFKMARIHQDDQAAVREALDSAGDRFTVVYRFLDADGKLRWLEDIGRRVSAGKGLVTSGVTTEASSQARLERAYAFVLDAIVEASDEDEIGEILRSVIRSICLAAGWRFGTAWTMDDDGKAIRCLPVSVFDGIGMPELREESINCDVRKGEGLIGRVWETLTPMWVEDLQNSDIFGRRNVIPKKTLRSAVAVPIKSGDSLFAVLEFFSDDVLEPDDSVSAALTRLGKHLSTLVQRKKMQSRLSEQEAETQVLLDLVPAMVWYKDLHNNIVRANKAACEIAGLKPGALDGKNTAEVYPDQAGAYYEDDLEVIRSGQPKLGIVEQIKTGHGQTLWVRTDKMPVCRDDGTVAGIVVFAIDITKEKLKQAQMLQDRKQLQTKIEERTRVLRDTESRLATISRLVPGVLYQFMVTKDGQRAFPYISESVRASLEYDPEELMNDASVVFGAVYPEDLLEIERLMSLPMQTLDASNWEGRIYTKSGKLRWFHASSSKPEVLANGDTLWSGILVDITDLKHAQQKINQLNDDLEQRVGILAAVNKELELLTQKLELSYDQAMEASRIKSEFVANISHEVRTPISAVIGMAELLLDTPLSKEQLEYTRLVRESAQSLLIIINDILDFSKMEAGKIDLEHIEFGLVPLVEGCADLLAASARERGLTLMTFVSPHAPRLLYGDPVRLRQVLLNLMSNAIKFTEKGEVIVRVTITDEQPETITLKFDVADTGIGLSESARKLLFQPFVQADGSTSRRYGGTGLGLSISRRLVELMGGTIDVTSELGKGSNFWFTIPFQAQRTALDEHPMLPMPLKALVFDENNSAASIIAAYLQSTGLHVDLANDLGSVFTMLRSEHEDRPLYNVALVGINSAPAEVLALAKKISNDSQLKRTRLIWVSDTDDKERIDRALAAGFSAAVLKPVRYSHLTETVTRILSLPAPDTPPHTVPTAAIKPVDASAPFKLNRPILVAEDNPVMQQLALRQIKKMGLEAIAASNGREVLEAVRRQQFALILMDCQMPEMDGFEATLAIRKEEAVRGGHTPIVAMTASAMIGDREHCLTSGMDDYLPKPVSQEQLLQVMQKWLPDRATVMRSAPPPLESVDAEAGEPMDVARLTELYGEGEVDGLLHSFMDESAEIMASIVQHFEERQARDLAVQAHQLKGLASVMCAEELSERCMALERAGKEHAWNQVETHLSGVKAELDLVLRYIQSLQSQQPSTQQK